MRILIVHNQYQYSGGEDTVVEAERDLLGHMGHDVDMVLFDNASIRTRNLVQVGVEAVWSRAAAARVRSAIATHRPDLMHVHNFFPLASPAIHHEAKRAGVRVLQTLHNFRLLCLSADFFRDGRICEDCVNMPALLAGVRHACYRGSLGASAAGAAMLSVHRLLGTWKTQVDLFLALSEFGRAKFIEGGIRPEQLAVKPNCLMDDSGAGSGGGGYLVYAGRLAGDKGVALLLEAWKQVCVPGKRLVLMGEGQLADLVRERAVSDASIDYRGRVSNAEVRATIANATALVFPSLVYETQGMVMVEALACGTPVIAFDIGGRVEMVREGETGWLLSADVKALADKMERLLRRPGEALQLRASAREFFNANFTAERNAAAFRAIFARLNLADTNGTQPASAVSTASVHI